MQRAYTLALTAIKEAPVPTILSQLRAFLGLVNYYYRFLSDLSSRLSPLHRLLQKRTKLVWGVNKSIQAAKDALR